MQNSLLFDGGNFIDFLASLRKATDDIEFSVDSMSSILSKGAIAGKVNDNILVLYIDCLLRMRPDSCVFVGRILREWIACKVMRYEIALEIVANWERYPVLGFDPNLGASFYEHLAGREESLKLFLKWKDDKYLRKRLIEVAYAMPINQELDLYEFALSVGEHDSVKSSIETFIRVRKAPDDPLTRARFSKILEAVSLKLGE